MAYGTQIKSTVFVANQLKTDWHTFGFKWTSEALTWFYDGIGVWKTTDKNHIPLVPLFTILSGQIKSYWMDCELE